MAKSILTLDEINLMKNSEEPKNVDLYGNLYDILCNGNFNHAVKLEDIIELDEKGQAALSYNKETLINNVKSEWYVESESSEDEDKKVRCGLCNTPNKYLYYIRNRINNKKLNVGSTCMTKFPGIDGYVEYKERMNKNIRNQQIITRRTKFHKAIPNVEEILDSATYYFENLPILLPERLYYPLKNTVKNLRIIYKDYVNQGKKTFDNKVAVEAFNDHLRIYNRLKNESEKFVEENWNNKYICKRDEVDWLEMNKKHKILQEISKNNGLYTVETAKQMNCLPFVIRFYKSFCACNKNKDIEFNSATLKKRFAFKVKRFGFTFSYNINIKRFMDKIGTHCIFDNNYTIDLNDLCNVSIIDNSNENFQNILNMIIDKLDNAGYALLIDDITDEIYLFRRTDKSAIIFKDNEFIKIFSTYVIQKSYDVYKYIGILTSKKWLNREELIYLDLWNKINNLYYQQYLNPNA